MVKVAIALAFGKSPSTNPEEDLRINRILRQRLSFYDGKGYMPFTDLGDPSPSVTTIDKSVKWAIENEATEFVIIAAVNGHHVRSMTDLETSLMMNGKFPRDFRIGYDEEVWYYRSLYYDTESVQKWTRSNILWHFYNMLVEVVAVIAPNYYRKLAKRETDPTKRANIF